MDNIAKMAAIAKKIGGGGGVSSWNDLTDRPFYDESWTATWDGDRSNPNYDATQGAFFYTDKITTLEQAKGLKIAFVIRYTDASDGSLIQENIVEAVLDDSNMLNVSENAIEGLTMGYFRVKVFTPSLVSGSTETTYFKFNIADTDFYYEGQKVATKGMLISDDQDSTADYTRVCYACEVSGGELKTLDTKYIPGALGGFAVTATVTFDDTDVSGTATMDKTFADTLAAINAGRYTVCYALLEGSGTLLVPAYSVNSNNTVIEFAFFMGTAMLVIAFNSDETATVAVNAI